MAQVTIYLDDETERKMAANAKEVNLSKSKWIANVIREKLMDDWPDTVRKLPGSWSDFPLPEESGTDSIPDAKRETL